VDHDARVDGTAIAGDEPGRILQVLHSEREAMERAKRVTAHHGNFGGAGGGAGSREVPGREGVHGGVDGLDAGDAALDEIHGGEGLGADEAAGLDGGQVTGFGHA